MELRSTDLNQGVVYGINTRETNLKKEFCTSFHYDHISYHTLDFLL